MIDDRNPVVRLYLSDSEAPYPLSEPITEQNVVELDAALQDGELPEGWSLQGMVFLATHNLTLACTLSMPKNTVVRCAQTLLELYVAEDSPLSGPVSTILPLQQPLNLCCDLVGRLSTPALADTVVNHLRAHTSGHQPTRCCNRILEPRVRSRRQCPPRHPTAPRSLLWPAVVLAVPLTRSSKPAGHTQPPYKV